MLTVSGVPISSGLGVTALERVLDGLLITGLFWALIPFMPIEATENRAVFGAAVGSGVLFVSAAIALIGMAMKPRWIRLIGEQTLGRVLPGLWAKLWTMMESFVSGLHVLQGTRNVLAVFGATIGYWGANALVVAGVAAACGMKLPWVAAPLILCVLVRLCFGSRLFRDLSGCSGSGPFAFWLFGITRSQFRNGALSIEYILGGGHGSALRRGTFRDIGSNATSFSLQLNLE